MLSRQPTTSLRSVAVAVVVVLGCLMLPARLGAQTTPTLELAGGVGAVYLVQKDILAEWLASVAWSVGDVLAIVGEVARLPPARHPISTFDVFPCESGHCGVDRLVGERHVDTTAFLVGPRFTLRSAPLKPFVHLLVGAARVTSVATLEELAASDFPLASQTTSMAFQIGAGVDIPMWERLTARLAADRRRLLGEPLFKSQFRLSAQLVLALGAQ